MSVADKKYKELILDIYNNGTWDTDKEVRAKYEDGTPAYSKSILSRLITFEEDDNNSYVKILNSTTYTKDFIKTIVLILSGNSDVGIDIKDGKITLSVPKPSND